MLTTPKTDGWQDAWGYPASSHRVQMGRDSSGQQHCLIPARCIVIGFYVDGLSSWMIYEPNENGPAEIGMDVMLQPKGNRSTN